MISSTEDEHSSSSDSDSDYDLSDPEAGMHSTSGADSDGIDTDTGSRHPVDEDVEEAIEGGTWKRGARRAEHIHWWHYWDTLHMRTRARKRARARTGARTRMGARKRSRAK